MPDQDVRSLSHWIRASVVGPSGGSSEAVFNSIDEFLFDAHFNLG